MDYTYTICILQHSHCSASSDQGKGVVHTLCVIGLSAGLQYTLYVVCVVTLGECTRVSSAQWQWWQEALMVHTSSDIVVQAI